MAGMAIDALPEVRVRRGGDLDVVVADDVVLRFACPHSIAGLHQLLHLIVESVCMSGVAVLCRYGTTSILQFRSYSSGTLRKRSGEICV